jgi:hypothetical protein
MDHYDGIKDSLNDVYGDLYSLDKFLEPGNKPSVHEEDHDVFRKYIDMSRRYERAARRWFRSTRPDGLLIEGFMALDPGKVFRDIRFLRDDLLVKTQDLYGFDDEIVGHVLGLFLHLKRVNYYFAFMASEDLNLKCCKCCMERYACAMREDPSVGFRALLKRKGSK